MQQIPVGGNGGCRVGMQFVAILFFFCFVGALTPANLTAEAELNAASSIRVEVEHGRLTLSVRDTPLSEVLQAIGEKAGIAIEIRGNLNARVTQSLNDVPLDEGISQLLRGQSFVVKYESPVNTPKGQQLRRDGPTHLSDEGQKRELNGPRRRWFLQVRSSPMQSEAIKLVSDLRAKGYHAYFVPAVVHGGRWFRVRLGPLSTESEARALRDTILSKEGFRDSFFGLDMPTVAPVNKLQKPIPQVAPEESNSTTLQRTTPVEISVLVGSSAESERVADKVGNPEDAQNIFQEIRVLANRKDADAIAKLSVLAVSDPNPTVRSRAVSVLGTLRDQGVLPLLMSALGDQSPSVRIQAMRGIKDLKGSEVIGDLYGVVANDPDLIVRRQALWILSEIESEEVLGLLNSAIADPDATVSREAREAVKIWEQRFGVRSRATGSTR